MSLGTLIRDPSDDYPVAVSFAAVDVFAASTVTTATVTITGDATLTAGSPSIAADVVTFRLYGGTAGSVGTVAVLAQNAASPANKVERSFTVNTVEL
jgi:hypothetical protein